jgi:hypothetical protein
VLDHPSDIGGDLLAYSCKMTGARNTVIGDTGPQRIAVAPGDRAIVLRQRLVLLPRQRWVPGRHAVVCSSGGVAFLSTGFDLTR